MLMLNGHQSTTIFTVQDIRKIISPSTPSTTRQIGVAAASQRHSTSESFNPLVTATKDVNSTCSSSTHAWGARGTHPRMHEHRLSYSMYMTADEGSRNITGV